MDAGTLHAAIAEVCPVKSTTVGVADDRATWSFVPEAGATRTQIDAGNNVIATIPIDPLSRVSPGGLITRFDNAEYLALLNNYQTEVSAGMAGNRKTWDILIGDSQIDMNSRQAKSVKNYLVSHGVLTQARADEIFS